MRVLMVTDDGRAIDRRILLEAETVSDLGHEVIIVARNDKGEGVHADRIGRAKVLWIDYALDYLAGFRAPVTLPDPENATEAAAGGQDAPFPEPAPPPPHRVGFWDKRPRVRQLALDAYRGLDLRRRRYAEKQKLGILAWRTGTIRGGRQLRLGAGIARASLQHGAIHVVMWPFDKVLAYHRRNRAQRMQHAVEVATAVPGHTDLGSFEMNIWELAVYHRAMYFDPDLIHVHDLPQLLPAVLAGRDLGVPVIYDAHEVYPEIGTLTPDQQTALRAKEQVLAPICAARITVNPFCAEFMEQAYDCPPFDIIMNATTPSVGHRRGVSDDRLRKRLNLSPDVRLLMFQGWMADVGRGLLELVAGMATVRPDVHLVMMGYGDLDLFRGAASAAGVADRVHILPPVPWDDLVLWSAAADVGIIPYQPVDLNHRVCSPNKLFEFISAGLPILANDLPFLTKVIEGEGFGITRRMETPDDMARAVNEMFDPAAGHIERARANLLARAEAWEWPVEAEKLKRIYARVASQPRGSPAK